MYTPKISVIIPIYKAEHYLSKCLDSFLAQTFHNFELILVDDGSPDSSGVICESYAQKDSRIRIVHKENGGVSSARQAGMDIATGIYTIHADPDDWVDSTMLEELYSKAEETQADMVICDYFENGNNYQKYISQKPSDLKHTSVLCDLLSQNLHGSCCNKLIRRACYTDFNVSFPTDVIRWEDLWVNCSFLLNPIKVDYLPKAFYHYDQCVNSESIVRVISKRGVESQISFCDYFLERLKDTDLEPVLFPSLSSTKELMYVSGLYTNEEIINTFFSINDKYIKKHSNLNLKTLRSYSLSHLLLGNYKYASLIKWVNEKLVSPIIDMLIAFLRK